MSGHEEDSKKVRYDLERVQKSFEKSSIRRGNWKRVEEEFEKNLKRIRKGFERDSKGIRKRLKIIRKGLEEFKMDSKRIR